VQLEVEQVGSQLEDQVEEAEQELVMSDLGEEQLIS